MERFRNRQNVFREVDNGPAPFVTNLEQMALRNPNFRTALWTGPHVQLTVMSIPVGGEIGLEVHEDTDQILFIHGGSGQTVMGPTQDTITVQLFVNRGDAIFVPAGTWHNVINMGRNPLKISTIYAPPEHPHGTVHRTKQEADMEEGH